VAGCATDLSACTGSWLYCFPIFGVVDVNARRTNGCLLAVLLLLLLLAFSLSLSLARHKGESRPSKPNATE
jgi:hypothetical protein